MADCATFGMGCFGDIGMIAGDSCPNVIHWMHARPITMERFSDGRVSIGHCLSSVPGRISNECHRLDENHVTQYPCYRAQYRYVTDTRCQMNSAILISLTISCEITIELSAIDE